MSEEAKIAAGEVAVGTVETVGGAAAPSEAAGETLSAAELPDANADGAPDAPDASNVSDASEPADAGRTAGDSADPGSETMRLMAARAAFERVAAREARRRSLEKVAAASVRSPRMIAEGLMREAEELTREYPEYAAAQGFSDERFRRLVRGGASVREAFEALNGEIVREAARAEERERIRQRGMRPAENGASAPSAIRASASALTPAGRAELARRAAAGERIAL